MKDVRELVVPGRLPGALVGLVGVLLALPSLVLPIQRVTYDPAVAPGSVAVPDFEQSYWSWGRVANTTSGPDDAVFDIGNTSGLLVLVLALAVGLAGVTAYAFRPGSEGRILGAVGLAWAASQIVGGLVRRLGDAIFGFFGQDQQDQFVIETQPAGVLEVVSAVLLVVALVLVVRRPLVGLVRSGVTRVQELARRGAAVEEESGADDPQDRPAPRLGIATIRDAAPGSGGGSRLPAGTQRGESPSGVGFSDAGPGTAPDADHHRQSGPDSGRFRPPR